MFNSDIGIITVHEDAQYLLSICDAAEQGKSVLPKPSSSLVDFSWKLSAESFNFNADNPVAVRRFIENLSLNNYFSCVSEFTESDWRSFLSNTRILPKGLGAGFKTVASDLSSLYDRKFQYKIGEIASEPDANLVSDLCAPGLHVGTWNMAQAYGYNQTTSNDLFKTLLVIYNPKDVVAVSDSKIRCCRILPVRSVYCESEGMSCKVPNKFLKLLSEA